jgi:hypothetical protein
VNLRCAFIACILLVPRAAWSQQQVTASEGSTIRLQLRDAKELQARLVGIREDSIVVQRYIDAALSSVARADITALEVRMPNPDRGRSAAYGVFLGALTGGTAYLVLSDIFDYDCDDCLPPTSGERLLGASLFIGGGATLGAFVGLLIGGFVWQPAQF